MMQTGFYCVVQFQPDRSRREGVNVGVIVVAERDREIRVRFAETNERARSMFPGLRVDDRRFVAATRALERRLQEVDRTEAAVRDFIRKEASQLVILPPLRTVIDDIATTTDRLYDDLVAAPRPREWMTCPHCSFSFDRAASTAPPLPAQVPGAASGTGRPAVVMHYSPYAVRDLQQGASPMFPLGGGSTLPPNIGVGAAGTAIMADALRMAGYLFAGGKQSSHEASLPAWMAAASRRWTSDHLSPSRNRTPSNVIPRKEHLS